MGKPLTICWYAVYLVGKYGLMFYNTLAYRSWHYKLGKRSFEDWWASTSSRVSRQIQKGFNSIVILCSWTLWNHRNRCVFDGISPNSTNVIKVVKEELQIWATAGARGISHLLALAAPAI